MHGHALLDPPAFGGSVIKKINTLKSIEVLEFVEHREPYDAVKLRVTSKAGEVAAVGGVRNEVFGVLASGQLLSMSMSDGPEIQVRRIDFVDRPHPCANAVFCPAK